MTTESIFSTKRSFGDSFSPESKEVQASKSLKMGKEENEANKNVSNSDILDAITKLTQNHDNTQKAIDEIKTTITSLDQKISKIDQKLTERVDKNETSILKNASRIVSIENEIARMRFSREIVITGIPETKDEDVSKLFADICRTLQYETNIPLAFVRRVKSSFLKPNRPNSANQTGTPAKSSNTKTDIQMGPIFVEFSLYGAKRQFMERYFQHQNLNLTAVGFQSNSRIYVNDRLTKNDMTIKKIALSLKKEKKLESVFVNDGKVYVRLDNKSKRIHIDNKLQLQE